VNTELELPIGRPILGEIWPKGGDNESVLAAIKVIRVATLEEYVNWINEKNLGHMVNRSIFNMNIYLAEVLD
jgi:hypothetical protein